METIQSIFHVYQKESTDLGHFYPVPQGAVVTSAPLCTTLRCYQKVKNPQVFWTRAKTH